MEHIQPPTEEQQVRRPLSLRTIIAAGALSLGLIGVSCWKLADTAETNLSGIKDVDFVAVWNKATSTTAEP